MSDVTVALGVTGKDLITGAFHDVAKSGEEMSKALMEHTKKLAEAFIGWETLKKGAEIFMQTLEEGGRITNLSDQTGIAAEKLTILERAFQNSGMEAETMGSVVNKMQKFLVEAGDSTSEAAYHIGQLGLNFGTLQQMTPDEQLKAIGQAIASIPDSSERAAAALGIFGKSGGKLMTFFKDFDEKVAESKEQLGEYSSIMGMNAEEFEKLGDTIKNGIGHKLIEFTAGALSNATGGLQELSDKIAKFDAAKFGKEITDGLGKPLLAIAKDLTSGNFKDAFELAYELVKLQAMKMGNELFRAFDAAIAGVSDFLAGAFSPDSYLLAYIKTAFTVLGDYIASTLQKALIGMLDGIPMFSKEVSILKYQLETTNREISMSQEALASGFDVAAGELGKVVAHAANVTEETYKTAEAHFDVRQQQDKIASLTKEQLEHQKKLTEGKEKESKATETTAKHTKSTVAALKEGASAMNAANAANANATGGARWTAKAAPIIDPAMVATGLYKNTTNLGLDMQEKLAASSMGISSQLSKQFDPGIKAAQAAGDWRGAAYLERKRAEKQQEEQEIGLRKAQLEDAGWSSAAAREQIEKERAGKGATFDPITKRPTPAPLYNDINKVPGPIATSAGTAGDAGASAATKDPMGDILKLLSKYLPSIDESADDIQTNTENFAVLA